MESSRKLPQKSKKTGPPCDLAILPPRNRSKRNDIHVSRVIHTSMFITAKICKRMHNKNAPKNK